MSFSCIQIMLKGTKTADVITSGMIFDCAGDTLPARSGFRVTQCFTKMYAEALNNKNIALPH